MESATKLRLNEIEKIRNSLEISNEKYNKTSSKFKRWHTYSQAFCALSGGAATILTGSGVAASLSVVGIAVGAPLIVVGTILTSLSTAGIGISRFFLRKSEKHKKLVTLSETTLTEIKRLTSSAINDGEITDIEYSEILKNYDTFLKTKSNIRYSNHTDGRKGKPNSS